MKIFTLCSDCVVIINEKDIYIAPYYDFIAHCALLDIDYVPSLPAGYKVLSISNQIGRHSYIQDFADKKLPLKNVITDISIFIQMINAAPDFISARENKIVISRPDTPVPYDITDRIA